MEDHLLVSEDASWSIGDDNIVSVLVDNAWLLLASPNLLRYYRNRSPIILIVICHPLSLAIGN